MLLCHVALLCALMNCFHNSLWPSDIISWHIFGSTLAQAMACCLVAPSHFLNQCCLIIGEVFSDGNFTGNTWDIYPWCEFDFIDSNLQPYLPGAWKIVCTHEDIIKWKCFLCYWPFVWGIHPSPVNSPHKDQWCRALMFSLICTCINGWVNNGEAGDLRRHHASYDVIVMYNW